MDVTMWKNVTVADEIVEKKSGLMKLLKSKAEKGGAEALVAFKEESLTEMPQTRRFVYYSVSSTSMKTKFTKFTINFSVLDEKTAEETRRKVYGQACWELVYLFVHLNRRQSIVSVIRDWYPELRAFVAKPKILVGLEEPSYGIVLGKHRKTSGAPLFVSPYQVVVAAEMIFAIDYIHIKPSKPNTVKDLFSEKCINLWKDPTPLRTWMNATKCFETRKPLFYDRVVNQKSEYGMYYVDFSELKPAPDDMELYLQGETSSKNTFFQLPFDQFVQKIPKTLLTVGTRQVSFFGCNLTSFDASRLASNYLWYLNVLVLMNNELTSLALAGSTDKPKSMCFLNLRELYACSNKLTRLPSALPYISTLTILDLRKNAFSKFPTVVCNCRALQQLDLGDNELSSIAPEIGKLTTLQEFYINNNHLTALPVELGRLFNLKTLMLQHNRIHKLPLVMANLTKLTTLELSGNPLVEPPTEVLTGGLDAMRSFMSDQLRSGERSFRMKLMFVGQENVGKTSLVRAIKRQIGGISSNSQSNSSNSQSNSSNSSNSQSNSSSSSNTPLLSTDGIDVDTLTLPHVDPNDQSKHALQFTVLDFAGQEIYYATHQVFLTERAVYMVVWDLRKTPKESRVDYWLHAITAAAPKSPIFLVGTHLDDKSVDAKNVLANVEVLISQYKKRFRIRGLEMVSCTSGDNISAMVTNICNAAMREPSMGAKFPTSHFIFEEHLQMRRNQLKDAQKAPIMTYDDIRNLAIDCGVIGSKATTGDMLGGAAPPPRARAGTFVPQSSRVRRAQNQGVVAASNSSKISGNSSSASPSIPMPAQLALAASTKFTSSSSATQATAPISNTPRSMKSNFALSARSATGGFANDEDPNGEQLIPAVPVHHPKLVAAGKEAASDSKTSTSSPSASNTPSSSQNISSATSSAAAAAATTIIGGSSSPAAPGSAQSSTTSSPVASPRPAVPALGKSLTSSNSGSNLSHPSQGEDPSGASGNASISQTSSNSSQAKDSEDSNASSSSSSSSSKSEAEAEDDAVLHNVLTLFHELGSIVYLGEHLDAFIILDPQWITKVFASVLTTKHNFAKEGLLSYNDVVTHLWGMKSGDFPPHLHPIMLDLLEHFQCIFKMPDYAISNQLLVPQFLPDKRPDMRLDWPSKCIAGVSQYTRLYDLGYTPVGLVGRILVTLMQEATVQSFWKNGMQLYSKQNPQHTALIELVEITDQHLNFSANATNQSVQAAQTSHATPQSAVGVQNSSSLASSSSTTASTQAQEPNQRQTASPPSSPPSPLLGTAGGSQTTSGGRPLTISGPSASSVSTHYRLSVTVRGQGCEDLFRTLIAVVDYICSAWYHLDALNDQGVLLKSAYCPMCISQGIVPPTEFTLRRCEACLSTGSIICTANKEDWHILRVDQVAPDLAWAEFQSKIVDLATEVTVLSELGSGSNGVVYKATYNSDYVAVKSCASIELFEPSDPASSAVLSPRSSHAFNHGTSPTGNIRNSHSASPASALSLPVMSVSALSLAMEELKREVQFLSSLRHPNLVQLAGFALTKPPTLLLEYVPLGPLTSFLTSSQFSASSNRFTLNAAGWTNATTAAQFATESSLLQKRERWPLILRIAFDVASAMLELHSARPPLVHGQLSQRKVYISSAIWNTPVVAKVSFVGSTTSVFALHKPSTTSSTSNASLSRPSADQRSTIEKTESNEPFSELQKEKKQLPPTVLSNLEWTAPEVLKGGEASVESDVYSFGIVLWQLVTRLTPYSRDNTLEEKMEKIIAGVKPDMSQWPSGDKATPLSDDFARLVGQCLSTDPSLRPSFSEIVNQVLPKLMDQHGLNDVWEVCKQSQVDLKAARREQEALIFGSDSSNNASLSSSSTLGANSATGGHGGATRDITHSVLGLQDLALGRWIANLNISNARVRKMLPVQLRSEVWCLTDLGHIFVFSMASGQFLRQYGHVLPSISSFAFCSLFVSQNTIWAASNKVIVKIPLLTREPSHDGSNALPSSSSSSSTSQSNSVGPNGSAGEANAANAKNPSVVRSIVASANFDWGAPVEGVLSIKDARYIKRAGWCRLANGVLHFYKRQGELMPWNVANISDIDAIEPHFQGHTTFLMRMKDNSVFMGGGRYATLPWQETITKQMNEFQTAAHTEEGAAKPVFYCSIDQRIWGMLVIDHVAWILLNDTRLVRWDLKESAPSGYVDLSAHTKQKERISNIAGAASGGGATGKLFNTCTMALVTHNVTVNQQPTSTASTAEKTTPNLGTMPAPSQAVPPVTMGTTNNSASASSPKSSTNTVVKKVLWVALQSNIIRISIPDGLVIDVLHAPQGDISLMAFHEYRNEVWIYSSGLLRIRNATTGKSQLIIPLDRPIHAMTPIGTKMWLHFNRNVQIWNEYRSSSELEHRHETPVHDIIFLEHNRTAWTCSVDAINVWK